MSGQSSAVESKVDPFSLPIKATIATYKKRRRQQQVAAKIKPNRRESQSEQQKLGDSGTRKLMQKTQNVGHFTFAFNNNNCCCCLLLPTLMPN